MTFADYVVLLQRRWRIWLSLLLIGILAAAGFSALSPKRYTAVATSFITVADTANDGSSEIFQGSQFVVQRVASYASLSSSPEVLNPVITGLGLDTSIRDLRKMVEVTSPPDTVLLKVSVTSDTAPRSAQIADAVSVQLAKVIETLETPRGRVASRVKVSLTQPADVPMSQSAPNLALNLLLGAVGGAAVGILAALLRHHLDRRIKSPEDIRTITGMSPLGSVPAARRPTRSDPLVAVHLRSLAAEQYRTIRTALRLAYVDKELHHFVVSSAQPGEGKTTVATNLAISWAQAGASVCLVDGGLRRPMVAGLLGLNGSVGLTEVLVGDVSLDEALLPWQGGLLSVLPAGSAPPDPAALLGSRATSDLVAQLRSRFDVVIYDSPPMSSVTDALVLARVVNGLVLVMRNGSTTREQLASCVDSVREARIKLLGTVRFAVKIQGKATHPFYADEFDWKPAAPADRPAATPTSTQRQRPGSKPRPRG